MKKIYKKILNNYKKRKQLLQTKGVTKLILNSRGYVIIIVLLITTLLISITSEFIGVSQTNIRYIKKFDTRLRATFLAKSGVELAKYILKADLRGVGSQMLTGKTANKNIDSFDDIWAIDFPPLPVDNGTIKLEIIDEQSKININAISNEFVPKTPYYGIIQRFFLNMGLPMDFADIIMDWIDLDDSRYPYGAETGDYYSTLTPSYSAKNKDMDSIDELLMLKDINPEIFYGLGGGNYGLETNLVKNNKGDVSFSMGDAEALSRGEKPINDETGDIHIGKEKDRALYNYLRVNGYSSIYNDVKNKININTAPYRVISALTDNMTDDRVTELISRRLQKPFNSVNEISDIIDDETIRNNVLTVKSYIFRIKSIAVVDNTRVIINVVYDRSRRKILYWSEE